MRYLIVSITFLLISNFASAEPLKGLLVEGALGYEEMNIYNPDTRVSLYNGISAIVRGLWPILDGDRVSLLLTGNARANDMNNFANNSYESEFVNLFGAGAGVDVRVGDWLIGADYNFMIARHRVMGIISRESSYNFWTPSYHIANYLNLGRLAIGMFGMYTATSIPGNQVRLSKDMQYNEAAIMVVIRYYTNTSMSDLFLGTGYKKQQ